MGKYKKDKLNPIDLIKSWKWDINHVEFDPTLKESESDFFKTKGSTHDGTMVFTVENLQNLLIDLANKKLYSRKNLPIKGKTVIDIKYKVGFIKLASVFGVVNINSNSFPGQRERCRISVKCEYIYGE